MSEASHVAARREHLDLRIRERHVAPLRVNAEDFAPRRWSRQVDEEDLVDPPLADQLRQQRGDVVRRRHDEHARAARRSELKNAPSTRRDVTAVSLLMSRCTSQPFEVLERAHRLVPTGAGLVHHLSNTAIQQSLWQHSPESKTLEHARRDVSVRRVPPGA